MTIFKNEIKTLSWMLLSTTCFLIIGCGADDGLTKRYAVTGKVTYKGQPVAKGSINFLPDKPEGRGANGQIVDGAYSMTTQDPSDGAFPGSYSVVVDALEPDMAAVEAAAKKKGSTSVALPQDMVAKAYAKAKNAVPKKYSQPATSGLKAEVKAGSNKFDFDLTD